MYDSSKADLRINGSGSAAGGNYNVVKISGTGKISGDILCSEFHISGSGEANGNVESDSFKINGSGNVKGNLKSQEIKVNGSANFYGDISCNNITISGSSDIAKNLDAQMVKINGSAKIVGDCNTEKFHSCGEFEIGGLLNADDIYVELYWSRSHVKEIGGENIRVMRGPNRHGVLKFLGLLGVHSPSLETDSIEGDEIYLENTTAKVVRGNNVTIGTGCSIGLVEYKGVYEKSGDTKVTEERKI